MGEDAGEKKIDPRAGGRKKQHYRRGNANQPKAEKYEAPTEGLTHMVWTVGTAEDATNYTKVKEALAKFIGASGKYKKCTKEAITAVDELKNPVFTDPEDPPAKDDPPTMAQIKAWMTWEANMKKVIENRQGWEETKVKIFQLIMQHVHPKLEERLKTSVGWEAIKTDDDVVGVMGLIRKLTHSSDDSKQGTVALVEHQLRWEMGFQKENESLDEFLRNFKARADVIDSFGGKAGFHPLVYLQHKEKKATELSKRIADLTDAEREACKTSACEEWKAALFIRIANSKRYKAAKDNLDNSHLTGAAEYPVTLEEAVRYLQNYKMDPSSNQKFKNYDTGGVAFAEQGREVTICYGCGKPGHPLKYCKSTSQEKKNEIYKKVNEGTWQQGQNHAEPSQEQQDEVDRCIEGVANINMTEEEASIGTVESVSFIQPTNTAHKRIRCGDEKLYLDSCATNHSKCTRRFLERIHTTMTYLRQNCNAGSKVTNKQGYWMGIPFWLNETGIANLLSLPKLEKAGWVIEYKTGGHWHAIAPDGMTLIFKKDKGLCDGMPYLDMTKPEEHIIPAPKDDVVFIETVRKNMEGFTAEEVKRAIKARDALAMMAHPPQEKLKRLVSQSNFFGNVPFTAEDISNSNIIFGPDRGAIRGKSVRQKPSRVRPLFVKIPTQLYEKLRDVTLAADVMFVNSLPFFVTVSRGIKMITVQFLPSRTASVLCDKLRSIMNIYRRGGYLVKTALMDGEFKPLIDVMDDVNVNTTSAREHVGDVERCIRLIKDRCRSVIAELPYKDCMPDQILIHLLYFVVKWLNAFPNDNGVSTEFSPKESTCHLNFKKISLNGNSSFLHKEAMIFKGQRFFLI